MSAKSFFIHNHPHYFRSDMGEKNKRLHALELNFLEGANVNQDYKPASETRDLMQEQDPDVPIRGSYLKPGDDLNPINKMKEARMTLQQLRLGLIRNS